MYTEVWPRALLEKARLIELGPPARMVPAAIPLPGISSHAFSQVIFSQQLIFSGKPVVTRASRWSKSPLEMVTAPMVATLGFYKCRSPVENLDTPCMSANMSAMAVGVLALRIDGPH
jgi:hypothetical protein